MGFPFSAGVSLIKRSGGRLVYTGRIARAPFLAWAASMAGRAAVADAAAGIRFSVVPRMWLARRRLWRQLIVAARHESVAAAMRREADAYVKHVGALAYADGLPRLGVSLRRLVAVPCVLVNAAAYRGIESRLSKLGPVRSLAGGDALRSFFFQQLVEDLNAAAASAQPTPRHALPAGADWVCVGLNPTFVWRSPILDWPAWHGHHYVLELTREPVTRAVRSQTTAAIERLEASLPSLSRLQRDEILRRAAHAA